jgi:hypothetical protein
MFNTSRFINILTNVAQQPPYYGVKTLFLCIELHLEKGYCLIRYERRKSG